MNPNKTNPKPFYRVSWDREQTRRTRKTEEEDLGTWNETPHSIHSARELDEVEEQSAEQQTTIYITPTKHNKRKNKQTAKWKSKARETKPQRQDNRNTT